MNLFLIGYRGSGKSTVARRLAAARNATCRDTDEEIERQAGCSIAEIFAGQGEQAFRERETSVLRELAAQDNQVISLGGGAVLRPENRELLQARGLVVWLRAQPETLWRRISADPRSPGQRPSLTTWDGFDEVTRVLAERLPLYEACARLTVVTDDKTIDEVVQEIVDRLSEPRKDACA